MQRTERDAGQQLETVGPLDPHVGDAVGDQLLEQHRDAGVVHLHAEHVVVGVGAGVGQHAGAQPEAEVEHHRRGAPERGGEVEWAGVRYRPEATGELGQGVGLGRRHAAADAEGAVWGGRVSMAGTSVAAMGRRSRPSGCIPSIDLSVPGMHTA